MYETQNYIDVSGTYPVLGTISCMCIRRRFYRNLMPTYQRNFFETIQLVCAMLLLSYVIKYHSFFLAKFMTELGYDFHRHSV